MTACLHSTLELLPSRKRTLRCRHCYLTLGAEELGQDCCPECFESSGKRNFDFEELEAAGDGVATYRCEECGVLVRCS